MTGKVIPVKSIVAPEFSTTTISDAEHPPGAVAVTEYVPGVFTIMEEVVSPVLQRKDSKSEALSTSMIVLWPEQIGSGALSIGGRVPERISRSSTPMQPTAFSTYTVYNPGPDVSMVGVFSPVDQA